MVFLECPSSKGLGFFRSEAPPLSQLDSWDMTSEQNAVRKQRGWVIRLERGVCYLAVSEQKREILSFIKSFESDGRLKHQTFFFSVALQKKFPKYLCNQK